MSVNRPTGNNKDAVTNKKLLTNQLNITALPFKFLPIEGIARFTALPMKGIKNEDMVEVIRVYFLMDMTSELNNTSMVITGYSLIHPEMCITFRRAF